jgi:hypothetical protein
MAARRIPGVRQLSKKETRELSKLPWVRDDALSDRGSEARVLPDGRVLLCLYALGDDDNGTLYPSREALAEMHRRGAEAVAKGPVDLTRTLLPPLDDFLRDAEVHAKGLGKALGVPEEALDRSLDSLDVAYKAVLRLRRDKRLTPEVFTPLTAYTGEVMRLVCEGRWTKMPTTMKRQVPVYDPEEDAKWAAAWLQATADVRARGGSVLEINQAAMNLPQPRVIRYDVEEVPITGHENEPVIQGRDGVLLQPFAVLLKEVVEHGSRGSLTGAISGTLARYSAARRGQSSGAA